MKVLAIRSDKPQAELYLIQSDRIIDEVKWLAHRSLSDTIHQKIEDVTSSQLNEVEGIIAYKGPGSFTGLRIGITVAVSLAEGLNIPFVLTNGPRWRHLGYQRLATGQSDQKIDIHYGSPANITKPKK